MTDKRRDFGYVFVLFVCTETLKSVKIWLVQKEESWLRHEFQSLVFFNFFNTNLFVRFSPENAFPKLERLNAVADI